MNLLEGDETTKLQSTVASEDMYNGGSGLPRDDILYINNTSITSSHQSHNQSNQKPSIKLSR